MANQTELNREMTGYLPQNAPLANPYVPFQDNNPKQYTAKKGLIRGTLFPGLDLPFMGLFFRKGTLMTTANVEGLSPIVEGNVLQGFEYIEFVKK